MSIVGKSVNGMTHNENWELISRLPEELTCSDGRKFLVTSWTPSLGMNRLATVTIEAIIKLPAAAKEKE